MTPPSRMENESASECKRLGIQSKCPSCPTSGKGPTPLAYSDPVEYLRRVEVLYRNSGPVILGNVLEWYDWTVYGYMEDVITEVFMHGSQTTTWLVFAVPFVARPLGSVLLGWLGDGSGRTVALKAAIWGMAITTVLQGCLPPHLPGAAWLLALLRFFSGLSAGGEAAGVNTYMTEVGGKDRDQTLVAAVGVNNVSGSLAFFVANAVSLAIHKLPRQQQVSWAWRVPFLLAAPLGLVSVALRRHLAETEAFEAVRASRHAVQPATNVPELEAVSEEGELSSGEAAASVRAKARKARRCGGHARATLLTVVVMAAITSCNYLPLYLATWLQRACGFSATAALSLAALSKVVQLLMTWPVCYVGDRIGATLTMLVGGVASVCVMLPSFLLVLHAKDTLRSDSTNLGADPLAGHEALMYTIAFLVLGTVLPAIVTFYSVPSCLYMTSLFPAEFRGRGAGVGLGFASMAGGFTPIICTLLAQQKDWLPGLFITLLTLPSLVALIWSRTAASTGALPIYQRPWLF